MSFDSILDESIRNLNDTHIDFLRAQYRTVPSILQRLVDILDSEPMAGFISAMLPSVDFDQWLESLTKTRQLKWPADRTERVALQIAIVQRMASDEREFLEFATTYCNAGYNSIGAHYREFASTILSPMIRDLEREAETRPIAPVVRSVLEGMPKSGDTTFDTMLADAVTKFRDSAPKARMEALEKLWDTWERLKSLETQGNKQASASLLLDRAAAGGPFREALEREAKELTTIGNTFHIRHFETDRSPLDNPKYVEYLFHRLFALIQLLVSCRT